MLDTEILNSIDPSNGEIVGSVTITDEAALKAMVERAAQAQLSWGQRPLHERSRLIQQARLVRIKLRNPFIYPLVRPSSHCVRLILTGRVSPRGP